MDITKSHAMHHSLGVLLEAGLITQKVGVSIDAQGGLYHNSMLEAFIAIGLSEPFISRHRYTAKLIAYNSAGI